MKGQLGQRRPKRNFPLIFLETSSNFSNKGNPGFRNFRIIFQMSGKLKRWLPGRLNLSSRRRTFQLNNRPIKKYFENLWTSTNIYENWCKLTKIDETWWKLARIGENWRKSMKTSENLRKCGETWDKSAKFHELPRKSAKFRENPQGIF